MVRSINYGFYNGQMSVTQRQLVIVCIPKEGKDQQFLKNWRPLTLLNTVYKIASSCIAARLKTVLPKLTGDDQKGFLKGSYRWLFCESQDTESLLNPSKAQTLWCTHDNRAQGNHSYLTFQLIWSVRFSKITRQVQYIIQKQQWLVFVVPMFATWCSINLTVLVLIRFVDGS